MKKAYVFPGQGSQFPGMAKDLYENNPKAKEMLERANEVLGFRITDIMFEGTPEDLKATKAALLYDVSSDYSQGQREFFIKNFERFGGKIVADEGFRGEDVDFRSQLTNMKNSGADVFIYPFMGKSLPLAVKQARELGEKLE